MIRTKFLVGIVALMLVAACNAFDNDGTKAYDGFGPNIIPPPDVGGGEFQGKYSGDMTLDENNCEGLTDDVGSVNPLSIDIVQNADLISVQFEGEDREVSGDVKDNKVTIVKRDASDVKIFHLEFTDEGIAGECNYIEGAPVEDQLGDPCAKYSVELTKE